MQETLVEVAVDHHLTNDHKVTVAVKDKSMKYELANKRSAKD